MAGLLTPDRQLLRHVAGYIQRNIYYSEDNFRVLHRCHCTAAVYLLESKIDAFCYHLYFLGSSVFLPDDSL